MSKLHSVLPPSSAARRVACPGSRAMEAQYPRHDSETSLEGDAAHWAAAEELNGRYHEAGVLAPNGLLLTEEMVAGAAFYRTCVQNIQSHELPGLSLGYVETAVQNPNIHPESWGTPDYWCNDEKSLHVVDYKFGHRRVEVFENWQLIAYAAGILYKIANSEHLITEGYDIRDVYLHIVQPRDFSDPKRHRTWGLKVDELQEYITQLSEKEYESMQDSAPCYPNPECNFCSARHACPTLQNAALTAADVSYQNDVDGLNEIQLGSELRYLRRAHKLLESRITGLEEQAIYKLKSGVRVPYFSLEQGYGRMQWRLPDSEVIALGQLHGVDLAKPVAPITPNQAEKKGLPKETVKQLSEKFPGAMKLVEDNPRKLLKSS